jgi:hypothetical protein
MKKILVCIVVISMLVGVTAHAQSVPETSVTIVPTQEDIASVEYELSLMDADIDMLARLVYAEARGVSSKMEQAAVIWCALNRVDAEHRGLTIADVVSASSQFAYRSRHPVLPELHDLAKDVLSRWLLEKHGVTDVGRVLPQNYLYFAGRRGHNWFRTGYASRDYWDWSLPDPYMVAR